MQEGKAREELKWGSISGGSGREVALVTGSWAGEDAGCPCSLLHVVNPRKVKKVSHSSTTSQVSGSADGSEVAPCHCIWGIYDQTGFEVGAQGDRCYVCRHFGFFIFVEE